MRDSFQNDVDDIGRWAYSNEKLAKDEFASSSWEGMGGQLDHEIAKGFSVFCRKCFPVRIQCQRITKNTLKYNSPIPRDLHLRRTSTKKLNVLVLVIQ